MRAPNESEKRMERETIERDPAMVLKEKREAEYRFYRDLYLNHGYRGPQNRKQIRHSVTDKVINRWCARDDLAVWLDVGAGEHVLEVPPTCEKLVRTDPGHPDAELPHAAHELACEFGRHSFDVVCCFDVLEHVFPEELDECILNLYAVCRPGGRIVISVGTDTGGPWNGKDVHLTQQPAEWWQAKLAKLLDKSPDYVQHVATAKGTSPFFVIDKPSGL